MIKLKPTATVSVRLNRRDFSDLCEIQDYLGKSRDEVIRLLIRESHHKMENQLQLWLESEEVQAAIDKAIQGN